MRHLVPTGTAENNLVAAYPGYVLQLKSGGTASAEKANENVGHVRQST